MGAGPAPDVPCFGVLVRARRAPPRLHRPMKAAEIRERFLSFFEKNGHLRVPSASLVPSSYDPSVLLTPAGMHPFKPYFRGEEEPPSRRLTSCQKSFRTVDIEIVGTTLRHLTFFEMLGNFSVGDYFKKEAAAFALDLSTSNEYGFGLDFDDIWITVFGGDEELGLGPDGEAIEVWRALGVPDDRIVLLGRGGQLLAVGSDRSVRPLLRALPRPRARVRPGHRSPRRRHGALPRVLEPRVHAVRAPGGRVAAGAADEEHRHWPWARADGQHPPGRAVGVRDRPVQPADRVRGGAVGQEVRRRLCDHARAADHRRPRSQCDLPAGRRRGPVQRGPRLHPAAHHAPGDPAGPRARNRPGVPRARVRARARHDEGRLPRARARMVHDRALGAGGGGELQPHPRAGRAAA